ncbi:MAG TPA: hypothetical protein VF131_24690 [Blastocatellia bacterium]|nr:hypothetical protein [Blastocatellia bacterium]
MAPGMSRRSLLRGLAIAPAAIIAAPVVSTIEEYFMVSEDEVLTPEEIAHAFVKRVYQSISSNQFIVRANNIVSYAQMWGGAYSVIPLFNHIGHNPAFAYRVNYYYAGDCKNNFIAAEQAMRSRNMDMFAGINRSPFDSNVAMLGSKTAALKQGQVTTQHADADAITLSGNEPDVARIAADFVAANYPTNSAEQARTVSYVKKNRVISNGVPVTTLTNANGGVVVYCSQPSGRATGGTAGVHVPGRTNSRNIPAIGLISSKDI